MRKMLVTTVMMLAISLASTAAMAQTSTQAGRVEQGADKVYTFTPAASGQLLATLTWDNQAASLIVVLVCGSDPPTPFGVGAGGLDRFARLESGVIASEICGVGVSTVNAAANFLLNLQRSGDQFSASSLRPPAGYAALSEARPGTLLYDETVRLLHHLKRVRR